MICLGHVLPHPRVESLSASIEQVYAAIRASYEERRAGCYAVGRPYRRHMGWQWAATCPGLPDLSTVCRNEYAVTRLNQKSQVAITLRTQEDCHAVHRSFDHLGAQPVPSFAEVGRL